MSAAFTYILFIVCLGIIAFLAIFSIKYHKKVKDITVNPVSVILSIFFFLGLWLADLTTLDMNESGKGLLATNALIPASTSQVPSVLILVLSIAAMFFINYYYHKISKTPANAPYQQVTRFLIRTQFTGLSILTIFAVIMIFTPHDASFLGVYLIGIYHSMLPLIIIPQIILALMIK